MAQASKYANLLAYMLPWLAKYLLENLFVSQPTANNTPTAPIPGSNTKYVFEELFEYIFERTAENTGYDAFGVLYGMRFAVGVKLTKSVAEM